MIKGHTAHMSYTEGILQYLLRLYVLEAKSIDVYNIFLNFNIISYKRNNVFLNPALKLVKELVFLERRIIANF